MTVSQWWRGNSLSVTGAAAVIAAASFSSRLLGVLRDRILASQFGAGDTLDVYYAAFRVPDLIYNLVIAGALAAGFIPVFVAARRATNAQGHWRLANEFLTATLLATSAACLGLALFAGRLVPLVTPGFSPEKTAQVVALSRIMFLSPILLGVSGVLGGVLQSYRSFFVYSLAPIFYNVGIIFGALFLAPSYGVTGLAWGVVLGAGAHLLVQLPTAKSLGWPIRLVGRFSHPGLREIGWMMIPRTLSLGVAQINLFALTIIASFLVSGSVAIFNLATNLATLPASLIGISYALAVFPDLSGAAARGAWGEFRQIFQRTVQRILFFIIPTTVLFILLRAQIVRVVLGSGAFTWEDTILTFEVVAWLSVSLFAQALRPLLVRAFYAQHHTLWPFIVGAVGDVTTLLGSLWLSRSYGVIGLAAAFSVGAIVEILGLWLAMRWRYGALGEPALVRTLGQLTMAGLVMAVAVQVVKTASGQLLGTTSFLRVAIQGGLATLVGVAGYVLVLYFLRSEELREVRAVFARRLAPIEVTREGLDAGEGI